MTLVTSVALLWLAATCPQQPEPVRLRHALEAGTQFAFVVETHAQIEFDEVKKNSRMHFLMHFAARVGATQQEHALVACRLARIEAHIRAPATRVDYDSVKPEDAGPLAQLAELVDRTFTVHVDPRGHIAKVDVPVELSVLARQQLGADFDSLFAAYFVPLPATATAVGDRWDAEMTVVDPAAAGASKVRVENCLRSVAGGRAAVERTLHLPAPPTRTGVTFAVKQADGTVVLDLTTGRVVTAELVLVARATREADVRRGQATTGTSTLRVRATAIETPPLAPKEPPHDR